MAATEALLTWSGLVETEEEESMATMRARLQAMTWAAQAKDAALQDMQSQLQAALQDAEQGRAREAALLRRAEKSEEAEEALASQMAELEAEAFTRITESNKLLAAAAVEPASPSPLATSIQVGELERRLQAALEDAAAWVQRCKALEEEVEQGRVREAALQRRAEIAEAGEEALATQMAEVEAEAFTRITGGSKPLAHGERCEEEEAEAIVSRQVGEELERRLAKAEEELKAAEAKLRQAEEKNRWLETRQVQEGEKAVTLKRGGGGGGGESDVLSVSLQDLARFVKLKLWNPSSLSLVTSPC